MLPNRSIAVRAAGRLNGDGFVALVLLAVSSLLFPASADPARAASYRSPNFVVTAADRQTAYEVAHAAERYRDLLSEKWLGRRLPDWSEPCPIEVQTASHLPARGRTSFAFVQDRPTDWRMSIQGPWQSVLHSVLPHEVGHTVVASYFGRPLPRWLEEGLCVTAEDDGSRSKLDRAIARALRQGNGMTLEKLFAQRDYPASFLSFYSQGYSLTQFLIVQGGERKLIRYITDGIHTDDWHVATRRHYGFASLAELQEAWVDWVLLSDI